jgi:hypothetical protein
LIAYGFGLLVTGGAQIGFANPVRQRLNLHFGLRRPLRQTM